MIWKLRRRFILICSLSILCAFLVLFLVIYATSMWQTGRMVDTLTDVLAANDGRFPEESPAGGKPPRGRDDHAPGLGPESRFSTRFFTAYTDETGAVIRLNMTAQATLSMEEAADYAVRALSSGHTRGWLDNYRYRTFTAADGHAAVVLVDGSTQRSAATTFLTTVMLTFAGGGVLVLLLVVLLSRRAVRPAAESYEKQKQFITDANHELKTPLTLILTNVDIAEAELGKNEWLDDIRTEGEQMSVLVRRLVALSRMDEDGTKPAAASFSLSDACREGADLFRTAAEARDLTFSVDIAPDVTVTADESGVRQVLSILLDNAVKYCDAGGDICLTLRGGRHAQIAVENACAAVHTLPLDRLFDRFFRADPARTRGEGFGIGLSLARATIEKSGGRIAATAPAPGRIRFTVRL